MANIYKLIPFITKWEGGYVDDPSDPGGPTNKGVTLKTWKNKGYDKNDDGEVDLSDLRLMTHQDMIEVVLRPHYWNPWQGDRIKDQSVANLVVDWAWCSGSKTIPFVQWILGVKPDGIVGPQTLKALNNYPNQEELFAQIKTERILNIRSICKKRPALNHYKRGWLNRISDLKYIPILLLCCLLGGITSCRTLSARPTDQSHTSQQVHIQEQASTADKQEQHSEQTIRDQAVHHTDSLIETMLVIFSQPTINDSTTAAIPSTVTINGFATLQRLRRTTNASTSSQHAEIIQAAQQSTTDTLTITRRAKARRVIPFRPILISLFIITNLLLITYIFGRYHRWKSD